MGVRESTYRSRKTGLETITVNDVREMMVTQSKMVVIKLVRSS